MYSSTNPENLDPEEEFENECDFCGEPCNGEFCDSNCKKAYMND
jgi:hypothetical protein